MISQSVIDHVPLPPTLSQLASARPTSYSRPPNNMNFATMTGTLSNLADPASPSTVTRLEVSEAIFKRLFNGADQAGCQPALLSAFRDFCLLWLGYGGTVRILYRLSHDASNSRALAIADACDGVELVEVGDGFSGVSEDAVRFLPVGSFSGRRIVLVGNPDHGDAGMFPPVPISEDAFKFLMLGLV